MPASRSYDRAPADIRPVTIDPGFVESAAGSALISIGRTRVICTASVQEQVPRWMVGKGKGWVTAEYAMLPASTGDRKQRDISKGKQDGRGVEIQRLIGRSLRVVVDFRAMGERSVYVDCDVLEADGGTRCAAITGGYVALRQAFQKLVDKKALPELPLTGSVAAVSVGLVNGRALCDLDYGEDSNAEVDANVVMTGDGASDETNLEKLLREGAAAAGERRAAYVCAIALIDADGHEYVFEARCEGTLLREARGSGGFGYDPAFVPDETGHNDHRTMAELSPAEKHSVSHRGKAARMLARHLGLEAGAAP